MTSFGQQPRDFPDGTIRRFLLGQLSANQQTALEAALFTNLPLEQRLRLSEIELIDDYVADRLSAKERAAFQQKFLVTSGRQKELEVSAALQRGLANRFAPHSAASSANSLFPWPRLAWRIAFSIFALAVLLASVLVIRREPRIVRNVIPKRWRPVTVVTPTPQAAHHPTGSSESPVHREEPPTLPAHEASPQTIVLRANSSTDQPPVVSLANSTSKAVRLELMLEQKESGTFSVVVVTSGGEVVHNVPEIRVEAADRIDFDVQIERLKAGEFQVTLTRLDDQHATPALYHFRMQ